MKSDAIERLLRHAYVDSAHSPAPEELLPESLDEMSAEDRTRLLQHADRCPRCAAELELARAFDAAPATAEPGTDVEHIVAELKRVRGHRSAPTIRRRSVMSWGLAAAAMLAMAVVGVSVLRQDGAPPLPPADSDLLLRSGRIEIVSPLGELENLPRTLEWESVPGAASYRVRLIRVDDSILFETSLETTKAGLPAETLNDMHRAVVYFWQVEALDESGAQVAASERVRFRATID